MSEYYAHYNSERQIYQSVKEHHFNTARIAQGKNPLPEIKNMLWLACVCHDYGKSTSEWQRYFFDSLSDASKISSKLNHSTIGGQLVRELLGNSPASEMIQLAVYSHHGLKDCIAPENSSSLFYNQQQRAKELPFDEAKTKFRKEIDDNKLNKVCLAVKTEEKELIRKIGETVNSWNIQDNLYGNNDFYLGMYERTLISLLIDADRRDTEDFMAGEEQAVIAKTADREFIWKECIEQVEQKQAKYCDKSGINQYRIEISQLCRKMAQKKGKIYQMSVPTGAGKTMSSLRFAVHYAHNYHKDRIIYVAPYNSILEQNAEEIRKAVGNADIVLEHHCNIILDNEDEKKRYDRLTEDWSSPIIATTAVQFLNTLFSGKTGNLRRMHSLCNSVTIFDEVQALPVKMLHLFNLAVNFLTEFADALVVLCTATQPLLDKLPQNRLRPFQTMLPDSRRYEKAFVRTTYEDCTKTVPGGMNVEQAAEFVRKKAEDYGNVLFIVNTKDCARKVYEELVKIYGKEAFLMHLSTGMCPEHRKTALEELRSCLGKKHMERPCICVSTALIEAGVDISFRCVIRSLSGLDNIIQSAGRCNRNGETENGMVYIVEMSDEAEHLQHMKDIRLAQEAMRSVLWQYHKDAASLDGRLDSEKAKKMYYERYFLKRKDEMSYPVEVEGTAVNLVELLSENSSFTEKRMRGQPLKQAFKTAGEKFEVIEDGGKETLVIEYDEEAKALIVKLEEPNCAYAEKKRILRKLQRYTVTVFQYEKQKISDGIRLVWDGSIQVLDERYYDKNIGVTQQAAPMNMMIM